MARKRLWPASSIETRPLEELVPYERNARTHSPDQIQQIAASMREWGWTNPILIDEKNGIIAGHGRWLAAKELGFKDAPCMIARGWTEAQRRAYVIADNQIALRSGWDMEMLALELSELDALDFNLDLLAFDELDIAAMLQTMNGEETLVEDAPAPPDKATTARGDLWKLGPHRLYCGDSSSPEDLDRLLGGQPIHLVNMDPPYNVKVEPRSNNAIAAGLSSFAPSTHHQALDLARHPKKSKKTTKKMRPKDRALRNDFVTDVSFATLLRAWFGNAARVLLPGRGFYVWGGYANCANYPSALEEIWVKGHPVLTRKDFMGDHEWCFYGWREGGPHKWYGPNNVSDVWAVKKLNHTQMVHLTEKPAELAVRAMQYSSRKGEHVLDLFGGSGSTMAAAVETGRRAFLMEIDEPYCDVIVDRYQRITGEKGVLENDGRSFEEISKARAA